MPKVVDKVDVWCFVSFSNAGSSVHQVEREPHTHRTLIAIQLDTRLRWGLLSLRQYPRLMCPPFQILSAK